jgi:hypothetical protein
VTMAWERLTRTQGCPLPITELQRCSTTPPQPNPSWSGLQPIQRAGNQPQAITQTQACSLTRPSGVEQTQSAKRWDETEQAPWLHTPYLPDTWFLPDPSPLVSPAQGPGPVRAAPPAPPLPAPFGWHLAKGANGGWSLCGVEGVQYLGPSIGGPIAWGGTGGVSSDYCVLGRNRGFCLLPDPPPPAPSRRGGSPA